MANFDEAKEVCKTLNYFGYESLMVGGFIRDVLIYNSKHRQDWKYKFTIPKTEFNSDIDISTNATPEQTTEVFKKLGFTVVPVGEKFGTVKLFAPLSEPIEITTYRSEGRYTDNRHPETVQWETDKNKDLERRDFTINAIAYDPIKDEIIDPFNGKHDIEARIIRCVGVAFDRFTEDPLRILRMFRFHSKLNFRIHGTTIYAAKKAVNFLSNIAMERVKDELFKILKTEYAERTLDLMHLIGVIKVIIPRLHDAGNIAQPIEYHKFDVMHHSFKAVDGIPMTHAKVELLCFAALLHDIGKEHPNSEPPYFPAHHIRSAEIFVNEIAPMFKLSIEETQYCKFIILHHMDCFSFKSWKGNKPIRRWLATLGTENLKHLPDLFLMFKADINATGYFREETLSIVNHMEEKVIYILNEKPCLSIKNLAISGTDIMNIMNISKEDVLKNSSLGVEIGKIQKMLLSFVIDFPEGNEKNLLLETAKTIYDTKAYLIEDSRLF
jgi:tRNA nucleotidyltransferase/poly(A) polymerase